MSYLLTIEGLAERIAASQADAKHRPLLNALRGFEALRGVVLAASRGDRSLIRKQVYTADGALVADDHRTWLKDELAKDHGDARATATRLRGLDLRLTHCAIETLYCIVDRGGSQDDFLQIEIDVMTERLDRRAFYPVPLGLSGPKDHADLVMECEEGMPLDGRDCTIVAGPRYELRRVFDAALFLDEAEELATAELRSRLGHSLHVTTLHGQGSTTRRMTIDELDPMAKRAVWRGRRFFNDWAHSSAGRSGARLSAHWVLQISDWTSPAGLRSMDMIPMWTHTRKVARINIALPLNELFAKLQALDERTGVPFHWYFYMLHGNLVQPSAGERMLEAVNLGAIDLPGHDLEVLKAWASRSYAF